MRSLLLSLPLLLAAAPARADRGEITEQTPYTLEPAELKVGLGDVSFGLFGHDLLRRIEVGTRPIAWLPTALGAPSYDVRAKFELWRDDHLSLAVAAEHLRVDLSSLVSGEPDEGADPDMDPPPEVDAVFSITPIEGWAGLRLGSRVRINAGAVYTRVHAGGAGQVWQLDELGGAVGTSSLQTRGNVAVRVSRSVHLVATGRFTPWQEQWAEARVSETTDGGGEVSNTTRGETDLMSVGGKAWAAGGEIHIAREHFNLRLGLEYGYATVPIVNFVMPQKVMFPVVDAYFRF